MRVDFHVHSKFSKRPSQWLLKRIGCPESFTEPLQIYNVARNRGMIHVTITDHNRIGGALEIAHLPNTFISEEITTYFPEDGCKMHVLVYGIDEAIHREIQHHRKNIFDLVAYLQQEKLLHVAAHPFYAINDRLELAHIEKMMLLFKHFELNGARNEGENECLRQVAQVLDKDRIERLSDQHGLIPLFDKPWEKHFFGGSDDHSSLNIARAYTTVSGPDTITAFLADPDSAELTVHSEPATPKTMAHNLYGIAYQYYHSKFLLERYTDKDPLTRFLDRSLRNEKKTNELISKLQN